MNLYSIKWYIHTIDGLVFVIPIIMVICGFLQGYCIHMYKIIPLFTIIYRLCRKTSTSDSFQSLLGKMF